MLMIASVLNGLIVICEWMVLGHLKDKRNIFRYYTYLQNALTLISSLLFLFCTAFTFMTGGMMPEVIKGLRYVSTCGLLAAMLIFIVFLGNGKKAAISAEEFRNGFHPNTANLILHYICPLLSCISYVLFERSIVLSDGIWSALAALPSCIYWIVYLILTITKRWEEPYHLMSEGKNHTILESLSMILIPISFIGISFILWNLS